MAAVAGPGMKVPILAGGPAAQQAAEILNPLGMNLTPVAAEYGRASAMKLSRSIVMKGIEAAMIEMTAAARAWEVEREVIASLQQTYPGIDWTKLSASCAERVSRHGIRRAQEMREAGDMLQRARHRSRRCAWQLPAHSNGAPSDEQTGAPSDDNGTPAMTTGASGAQTWASTRNNAARATRSPPAPATRTATCSGQRPAFPTHESAAIRPPTHPRRRWRPCTRDSGFDAR